MPIFCNYHPTHYAAFSCPKCKANLCGSCIVKKKSDYYGYSKHVYLCPKCTVFVHQLPFSHAIEPFWKRLPSIFQYPLRAHVIALIIGLSLIQSFFVRNSLPGMIVHIACFAVLLTYACLALSASANGRLQPPAIDPGAIFQNLSFFFKQLGLYIILFSFSFLLLFKLIPLLDIENAAYAVYILGIVFLLFLPAMIIILAVTKSLWNSIFPPAFIALAWKIGWPYLALCFFLTILLSAPVLLASHISKHMPQHVSFFLANVFSSYYMIVSYHLMGYILFQYHEKVGYDVAYEGDMHSPDNSVGVSKAAELKPTDHLFNQINLLIRDGNYDAAIAEIKKTTQGSITDPALADRYYNLLSLRKLAPEMLAFAPEYIKLMQKTNQKDKICAAYLLCIQLQADFIEDDPTMLFMVGKTLLENNYPLEALKVFDRFAQRHAEHSLAPNSYYFIARIFNEKLNNPARAGKIVEWLLKKYPFHENTSFVQAYAKQIKT